MDAPGTEGPRHSIRSIALRLLAAVAVAAAFYVVDRVWLQDDPLREQFGAKVKTFEIESSRLDRTVTTKVVVPKKAPPRDRSLLVFLHGRGEDERSYLNEPMFEALGGLAGRAPVVAFPFGGDSSYWHDRESGDWASYVLFEVIPQISERFDIDPDRIAIGGISMGGYGAFNVARLDPGRFCGVGGHSPALWESAGETADGAFDDAEDFSNNDVIAIAETASPSPYAGLRLWLDAGDDDPFLPGDEAFEEALRESGARPVVKRSPGGHDSAYWDANWDEYFRFYAHALNVCTVGDEITPEDDEGDPAPEEDAKDEPRGGGANGSRGNKQQPKGERPSGSSSRRTRGAARSGG